MRPGRNFTGVALILLLAGWGPSPVCAESLSLTTYYPSPRAVYEELQTTGDTHLAIDPAGLVAIGPPMVGPNEKLDVNGNIRALRFLGLRVLPTGAIAIFEGPCPAGWTRVAAFDGRTIRGAPVYGATGGGALNHTHTVTHQHTTNDPGPRGSNLDGAHAHGVLGGGHTHGRGWVGVSGGSGTGPMGIDGGGNFDGIGNHGHWLEPAGTWAAGGGWGVAAVADHSHVFDFPAVTFPPAPAAVPTTASSSQPPFANMVFCSSP